MGREVPVPLAREPEVLWGLTVGDLIWPAAAVVVDVALWHWSRGWGNGRWLVVGAVSLAGAGLAWARPGGRRLPELIWWRVRFRCGPRRFLPPRG